MRLRTLFLLIVLLALTSAYAVARQNAASPEGAAKITLEGGFLGNVLFPHDLHQKRAGDCKVCHQLYPQEKGTIGNLKASGALEKQQVMNSQCIECHRNNEKEGKPAGPTQCSKCHKRS